MRIQDAKQNGELEGHEEASADNFADIGTKPCDRAHTEMLAGRVNLRSLRALGWPTSKTALTALTAGNVGSQIEGADAQAIACECGADYFTIIYMVLLAAASAAAAYYLGRRAALAELHKHNWKRLETLMSAETPRQDVEQVKSDPIPMLAKPEVDEEGLCAPLLPPGTNELGSGPATSGRSRSSSTSSANSAWSTHKVYCRCPQCEPDRAVYRRGERWRCSETHADISWPIAASPWACRCGAVWELEEASDDEDETTTRRSEGGQGSWSSHQRADRGKASSYGQGGSENRLGPVARHLPARATTAALPPPPEGMWNALVTAEDPDDG